MMVEVGIGAYRTHKRVFNSKAEEWGFSCDRCLVHNEIIITYDVKSNPSFTFPAWYDFSVPTSLSVPLKNLYCTQGLITE